MSGKKRLIIRNWALIMDTSHMNEYSVPELAIFRITGEIHGHPEHRDGSTITTSNIKILEKDNKWVQTQNTKYYLGNMKPSYKTYLEEWRKSHGEL